LGRRKGKTEGVRERREGEGGGERRSPNKNLPFIILNQIRRRKN